MNSESPPPKLELDPSFKVYETPAVPNWNELCSVIADPKTWSPAIRTNSGFYWQIMLDSRHQTPPWFSKPFEQVRSTIGEVISTWHDPDIKSIDFKNVTQVDCRQLAAGINAIQATFQSLHLINNNETEISVFRIEIFVLLLRLYNLDLPSLMTTVADNPNDSSQQSNFLANLNQTSLQDVIVTLNLWRVAKLNPVDSFGVTPDPFCTRVQTVLGSGQNIAGGLQVYLDSIRTSRRGITDERRMWLGLQFGALSMVAIWASLLIKTNPILEQRIWQIGNPVEQAVLDMRQVDSDSRQIQTEFKGLQSQLLAQGQELVVAKKELQVDLEVKTKLLTALGDGEPLLNFWILHLYKDKEQFNNERQLRKLVSKIRLNLFKLQSLDSRLQRLRAQYPRVQVPSIQAHRELAQSKVQLQTQIAQVNILWTKHSYVSESIDRKWRESALIYLILTVLVCTLLIPIYSGSTFGLKPRSK